MMPEHLFVCSQGDLYDIRKPDWHKKPPFRKDYLYHHRVIQDTQQLKACIRAGKFAWPGGYPLFFVTSDGAALSFAAVLDNWYQVIYSIRNDINDGWKVVALSSVEESDETVYCDHTDIEIN